MKQTVTVREARLAKRPPMTQEVLAAIAKVDQTYISLVERLLRPCSGEVKQRLAVALDMPVSDLRFAHAPDEHGTAVSACEDSTVSPSSKEAHR